MAGFLAGLLPLAGRLLSSGSLLKSAYSGGSGLMNLAMDAIPLVTDIANDDVGLKSFTGFAGTMAGTKFGGRELNKKGLEELDKGVLERAERYNSLQNKRKAEGRPLLEKPFEFYNSEGKKKQTSKLLNDPEFSRQGYNLGVGMGADIGLYSLTSGMGKPKEPMESTQLKQQQDFYDSPVSRYIQMTGAL